MKFENTYRVGAREININNEISNYGILSFLEDIASLHSDSVGYGVKDIYVKKRAWILMDWHLNVKKRARFGDVIKIKTWAIASEKPSYHTYRGFEVTDIQDNIIATAITRWVFLDLEKSKICKVDENILSLYKPEPIDLNEINKIQKLNQPNEYSSIFEYTANRFDIDVNLHMHNLNYLNLAYEALPDEIYNGTELNNVHIMYKHQIKLKDKVKCFYSYNDNSHYITIKSQDEKTMHSIIKIW